ncbi:MAG: APC family permease [Vampirovibrionales bacterium]
MFSLTTLKRLLIGTPLSSDRESHERLSIPIALSVFAADALSSSAYATEEILMALTTTTVASMAGMLSIPIALAIVLLMAVVVISYRQVIQAYDDGGGTYRVSKEHLGPVASKVAGASLMIDYVLTASVSTAAGVDALISAGWLPPEKRVLCAMLFIALIMYANLRGVKESGVFFSIPAFAFIGVMVWMITQGLVMMIFGHAPVSLAHLGSEAQQATASAGLWNMAMLLALVKAFSHGCTALTGIEAISNGVRAFKEPVAKNANTTLVLMACILAYLFVGMTLIAYGWHILPQHNLTVIAQVGQAVFGAGSWGFSILQLMTTVILVFAANTAFAGFPRLTSILAFDGYLPRQLMSLGDRLVFSNGVFLLGLVSIGMLLAYKANTHAMIPLYAVGVFLSFTLAQLGMVKYHLHHRQPHWQTSLSINAVGAITTAVATIILLLEKFIGEKLVEFHLFGLHLPLYNGAWMVIVAIGVCMWVFASIYKHYQSIARQLALPVLETDTPVVVAKEHTVLVLVSSLHRGTIPALEYAKTISERVEAVHVQLRPELTERLMDLWETWGLGVPLTVLKSPYRSMVDPLLDYIDEVEARYEHDLVTIIIPEFVTKQWWHTLLHNQSSLILKARLALRKEKVVIPVRLFLDE